MIESKVIVLSCLITAWIAVGQGNPALAQTSDISDAYWSIVVPRASAFDVDMGQTYVNETRDSVLPGYLSNISPIPVRVDSVLVAGPDAAHFRIQLVQIPIVLPPGGTAAATCRFTPFSNGLKTAAIIIYTQADTIVQSLCGEGLSSDIQVIPEVIDFGSVEVDSDKDTTILDAIRNTGSGTLIIAGTTQLGPDRAQFSDITGIDGFAVAEGNSRAMTIRFSPRKPGRTSGRMVFQRDGPGSTTVVYLYGDGKITKGLAETGVDTVAFGPICVGAVIDTTVENALRNVGMRPLLVKRVELLEVGEPQFACRTMYTDFRIMPGETVPLNLSFAPTIAGAAKGQILLHHDGLDSPAILHIVGAATVIAGTATLGIDTVRAFAGETVRIPVLLKAQHNLLESGATSISAELRYNATLLSPIGSTPVGRLEAGERVHLLNDLRIDRPLADTLIVMKFLATLGNAAGTPLILGQLSTENRNATITAVPGYFSLLGLCEEGGERLVDATGTLSLQQNHPNPFNARTTITFEIIERGITRLLVKDLLGRTVATLVDRWLEPGQYAHSFDASALPSGSYLCILQTPARQLMRRMEVMK